MHTYLNTISLSITVRQWLVVRCLVTMVTVIRVYAALWSLIVRILP